jgi:multidrug resistance protein MdtO
MSQQTEIAWRDAPGGPNASIQERIDKIRLFWRFIADELKPFPRRAWATTHIVIAVVVTVIVSETLRVPFISYSAYAVFFIANDDGRLSLKLGILGMMSATVALAAAMVVSICFMDTPWFRLPATLFLMAAALWLSRASAMPVMVLIGRFVAVIFALYLSLADTVFFGSGPLSPFPSA